MHFRWLSLRVLPSRTCWLDLPSSHSLFASLFFFASAAIGFCVDESSAPTGSGGAAQEEMFHPALLP